MTVAERMIVKKTRRSASATFLARAGSACGIAANTGKNERPTMSKLQNKLDGDVPSDVPQWIVEFYWESDERGLTPMQAVERAVKETRDGHCWIVMHVRSGLVWSIDLGRREEVEVEVAVKK